MALMITICHSNELARRCSWIYHTFGWIVPLCVSLIIYFYSLLDERKEIQILGIEKFGKMQIILSVLLLVLCILINTISLLRITRRGYRLRHDLEDNRSYNTNANSGINEVRPLIDDDEQIDVPSLPASKCLIRFD